MVLARNLTYRVDERARHRQHLPMTIPASVIMCSIILGGWTFIWLTWMFRGDVRAWLAALLFPRAWRQGKSRLEVAALSPAGFTKWITMSASIPPFFCNLLSCHYCCSAHVAGSGAILIALQQWVPLATIPLVWAAGAALGIVIYEHTYRIRNN